MKKERLLSIFTVFVISAIIIFVGYLGSSQFMDSHFTGNAVKNQTSQNIIIINELSKHNTLSDCWVVQDQEVYDITLFLSRHPSNENSILSYCGLPTGFEKAFLKSYGVPKLQTLKDTEIFKGNLSG